MARPCTEFVIQPLKSTANNIHSTNTPEGKILSKFIHDLETEATVQHVFCSTQVEHPETLMLVLTWDTLEDHLKAVSSEHLAPSLKAMKDSVEESSPLIYHVYFPDSPLAALSAPATEVLTMYFSPEASEETVARFDGRVAEFLDKAGAADCGMVATTGGFVHEEVEHASFGGRKGRAYVTLIGWEGLDAHARFRDTEGFKANVGVIRGQGQSAVEMVHMTRR